MFLRISYLAFPTPGPYRILEVLGEGAMATELLRYGTVTDPLNAWMVHWYVYTPVAVGIAA